MLHDERIHAAHCAIVHPRVKRQLQSFTGNPAAHRPFSESAALVFFFSAGKYDVLIIDYSI